MLPTKHWAILKGTLTAGQRASYAHGLVTGQFPAGVIPDAVHPVLNNSGGGSNGNLNVSIDTYATADAANVYLSNWDPANARSFAVMVRSFHSIDSNNF